MDMKTSPLLLCAAVAALLFQNMVVCGATNFQDQKNFFHLPNVPTPSTGSYTPPSYTPPAGGGHATPTPSHGTPSHSTPPANCGNPPSSSGHHKTPSAPTGGHHTTPSPPRKSGGGYYHSPPTSTPTTPSTPTPTTPSTPTPTIVTPPTTRTPSISIPSPPSSFDPNSPPFTCTYWKNHPTLIWGVFGIWGTTVGTAFGLPSVLGTTSKMNLLEALSNTRFDGFGDLYREGTAALLNSVVDKKFPYTTSQVKESFVAALSSNKSAAAQAQDFKLANEGKHKH